jgi:hypothetical protein
VPRQSLASLLAAGTGALNRSVSSRWLTPLAMTLPVLLAGRRARARLVLAFVLLRLFAMSILLSDVGGSERTTNRD